MNVYRPRIPQRILMTADTVGGVWTYAVELTRHVATRGVEIALATMGAPLSDSQREEIRQIPNLVLFESSYRLEWMQDPWEDIERAGEWLLDIEAAFRPDIVHLNSYAHGALPWQAPVLMVGHSCVLSWWQAVRGESAPECWEHYRSEVSRGLSASDVVVAPSRAMLLSLEALYGPFRNSRVIPNGRRINMHSASVKEPFILAAGRLWDEAKNVRILEEAAPRLSWPVHVAGEQRHPDGGTVRCDGLCLLGNQSSRSLAEWFSRAAVYALPARYEPFGLTALEAALAGCALVLGDIPSLREIWGDAALFVPPDDADTVVGALEALIADAPYRARLAARAHVRAVALTPERMTTEYLDAYAALLRRSIPCAL